MTDSFKYVDEDGDELFVHPRRTDNSGWVLVGCRADGGDDVAQVRLRPTQVNLLAQYLDQHRTDTPCPTRFYDSDKTNPEPLPADATLCGTRWAQVREDMADMDKRLREAERTLARAEAVKEHADTVEAARQAGELRCACGHGWAFHGRTCAANTGGSKCPCTRFTLGARS